MKNKLKQEAIERYPKGTKIRCLFDGAVYTIDSFDEVTNFF